MEKYLSSLIPFAVCAAFAAGYAYFESHQFFGLLHMPRPTFRIARALFFVGAASSVLLICLTLVHDLFSLLEKGRKGRGRSPKQPR